MRVVYFRVQAHRRSVQRLLWTQSKGPMRVLIVDDNSGIRELLRYQLNVLDGVHVVCEAAEGATAVAQAEANQPDLVILDLDMPGMSGTEALPLLRRASPAAVIAVHSATPQALAPDGLLDAVDAYLQKGADISSYVRSLGPR